MPIVFKDEEQIFLPNIQHQFIHAQPELMRARMAFQEVIEQTLVLVTNDQ